MELKFKDQRTCPSTYRGGDTVHKSRADQKREEEKTLGYERPIDESFPLTDAQVEWMAKNGSLNAEQRAACEKMGLSKEDYIRTMIENGEWVMPKESA